MANFQGISTDKCWKEWLRQLILSGSRQEEIFELLKPLSSKVLAFENLLKSASLQSTKDLTVVSSKFTKSNAKTNGIVPFEINEKNLSLFRSISVSYALTEEFYDDILIALVHFILRRRDALEKDKQHNISSILETIAKRQTEPIILSLLSDMINRQINVYELQGDPNEESDSFKVTKFIPMQLSTRQAINLFQSGSFRPWFEKNNGNVNLKTISVRRGVLPEEEIDISQPQDYSFNLKTTMGILANSLHTAKDAQEKAKILKNHSILIGVKRSGLKIILSNSPVRFDKDQHEIDENASEHTVFLEEVGVPVKVPPGEFSLHGSISLVITGDISFTSTVFVLQEYMKLKLMDKPENLPMLKLDATVESLLKDGNVVQLSAMAELLERTIYVIYIPAPNEMSCSLKFVPSEAADGVIPSPIHLFLSADGNFSPILQHGSDQLDLENETGQQEPLPRFRYCDSQGGVESDEGEEEVETMDDIDLTNCTDLGPCSSPELSSFDSLVQAEEEKVTDVSAPSPLSSDEAQPESSTNVSKVCQEKETDVHISFEYIHGGSASVSPVETVELKDNVARVEPISVTTSARPEMLQENEIGTSNCSDKVDSSTYPILPDTKTSQSLVKNATPMASSPVSSNKHETKAAEAAILVRSNGGVVYIARMKPLPEFPELCFDRRLLDKTFACPFKANETAEKCGRVHDTRKSLLQHLLVYHKANKCTLYGCPYIFPVGTSEARHMKEVHSEVIFVCKKCCIQFPDIDILREHVQINHADENVDGETTPKRPSESLETSSGTEIDKVEEPKSEEAGNKLAPPAPSLTVPKEDKTKANDLIDICPVFKRQRVM